MVTLPSKKFLLLISANTIAVFCVALPIDIDPKESTAPFNRQYSYIRDDSRSSYKQIMALKPHSIDEDHVAKYMMAAPSHQTRIDLSVNFPTPFTQGKLGSCTAASLIALLLYDMKKSGSQNLEMKSILYLYYWARFLENSVNYDSGVSLSDGLMAMQKFGVCRESLWEYNINNFTVKPTKEAYLDALAFKDHLDPKRINKVSQNLNVMKAMLNRGTAFACGIKIYESFESKSVENSGLVLMPQKGEESKGSHAVVFAGYDDDVNGGCFLVRNSWGPSWGTNFEGDHLKERGYFWLPYKYATNSKLAYDFWTISSIPYANDNNKSNSCLPKFLKKLISIF